MKYGPLIWSGIWRRRGRAVLMLLQIVCAFTLFGVLQGVSSGTRQAIAATHSDRLYVASKVSASDPLPIALLERIRATPGIREVSPRAVFLAQGDFKSDDRIPVIAVDAEPFFRIYDDVEVSPEAIQALKNTRAGALVGSALAQRHRVKVGDRLALFGGPPRREGTDGWAFDIVGVYSAHGTFGAPPPTALIANFDYVNRARATDVDRSSMFLAKVGNADDAGAVSLAIDNAFANSAFETRTQSEGDLVSTQLKQTVDLDFIVRAVVAAVFFALLLSVGALMMRTLRERRPELAVLKAVGFTDGRIVALILTESIAFCVVAASIGLAAGAGLLPLARGLIGITRMPWNVVVAGLVCAIVLALVAGAVPAMRGSRVQVADALAGR
jgi:putative ABC transport system permease protein